MKTGLVLAGVCCALICLVMCIREDPMVTEVRRRLQLLEPNISFTVSGNKLTNSTFTINKRNIYICTRTKDLNTLVYVGIHELAHIRTHTYGHNKDFVVNFKALLNQAVQMGLWNPVDYSKSPEKYCNTTVRDQLYFV